MHASGLTLLIPDKRDPERDAVADAWTRAGGLVHRLGRFWDPPALDPRAVRLYGNETFCLVLQQKLGLSLTTPKDDLLLRTPGPLVRRAIRHATLASAPGLSFPRFIKSIIPKQVESRVYATLDDFLAASSGLDQDTELMTSDVAHLGADPLS